MQQHLELIRPVVLGSTLAGGWVLVDVTGQRSCGLSYVFRREDAVVASVTVFVHPLELGGPSYCHTKHHALGYHSDPGGRPPPGVLALVDHVAALVRTNERASRQGTARKQRAPACPRTGNASEAVLHLVPGHIGEASDIGGRGWRLLAQVSRIFVEEGVLSDARELLRAGGIDPETRRLIEVPHEKASMDAMLEELRSGARQGEAMCLFGVAEGAPAFVDPGSELIAEAVRLGVRVCSVGGPSALTLALMRIEVSLQEFLFLGRLETSDDVERMARRAEQVPDLPLVIFTDGRGSRTLLAPLLERIDWARGWLLSDLTTDREVVIALADRARCAEAWAGLAEDARIVVILHPSPD